MGIFSKESLAASALFTGAPKHEVDRLNDTLRCIGEVQGYDNTPPPLADPWRPNRKDRRAYSRSFRQRTRVTGISKRSSVATPKRIHETINDKGYQLARNPVTHRLLVKGGYVKQGGEAA